MFSRAPPSLATPLRGADDSPGDPASRGNSTTGSSSSWGTSFRFLLYHTNYPKVKQPKKPYFIRLKQG